ncbi:MAG TPA: hypothetical protein VF066_07410 [Thermoleophilaceae bacterium]
MAGVAVAADDVGNERTARADAADALGLLRLPDGAARSDENPAADPQLLESPGLGRSASPNQIEQSEFWRVPGDPSDAIAWVKAHPPAGTRLVAWGKASNRDGPTTWSAAFERRPVPEVMVGRQLAVTVAKAADGGTALRADGFATWLVVRPASERIPAGAEVVQVTITGHFSTARIGFAVRDKQQVALVTRILNRLPVTQPGLFMCPLDRGIHALLTFRGGGGATIARADATLGGCAQVDLTIDGARQPSLNGYGLLDDLEAVLGRPIDLTPFSQSDFTEASTPVARVAHGRVAGMPFDAVAYNGGPQQGLCMQLFVAGVRRGIGCLLHLRGKRTSTFPALACYPRAVTGVGALGRNAATEPVRFDDGETLRPALYSLPHASLKTTIGLQGDRIVPLSRPAKLSLGYRGPFAIGFRRGVHDLDTGFGAFARC